MPHVIRSGLYFCVTEYLLISHISLAIIHKKELRDYYHLDEVRDRLLNILLKQIIDEKSLIKKYQREISVLKHELDQLKKGMQIGVNHEEIMSLKQKVFSFPGIVSFFISYSFFFCICVRDLILILYNYA